MGLLSSRSTAARRSARRSGSARWRGGSRTRGGGPDVVVVVSAMGHTTDELVALARR
jgi:hypothetical protein